MGKVKQRVKALYKRKRRFYRNQFSTKTDAEDASVCKHKTNKM